MKASNDGKSADVFIYGEITKYAWEEYGEMSSTLFKDELDSLGEVDTIHLYINSPGGSVFEGVTIYNMLKRHKAQVIVHVDAVAASIASVIAMAGDEIRMPTNSMLMIHNALIGPIWGNAQELRKYADDVERISQSSMTTYLSKAGDKITEEKLQELLDAETWLSADEAYQYGLCDVVEDANEMVASVSEELFAKYKNVPKQLKENQTNELNATEMAERQKIADEAKQNQKNLELILGGL